MYLILLLKSVAEHVFLQAMAEVYRRTSGNALDSFGSWLRLVADHEPKGITDGPPSQRAGMYAPSKRKPPHGHGFNGRGRTGPSILSSTGTALENVNRSPEVSNWQPKHQILSLSIVDVFLGVAFWILLHEFSSIEHGFYDFILLCIYLLFRDLAWPCRPLSLTSLVYSYTAPPIVLTVRN